MMNTHSLLPELDLACRAAKAAGAVLRDEFQRGSEVKLETSKDIKLDADVHAERTCLRILRDGSNHPILSEEAGEDAEFADAGLRWVVDPLDGTFNFSRGLPLCCVSVGLCDGQRFVLGVIYDFNSDVLYRGLVGVGAWRNDTPIRVSSTSVITRAAICTGFPAGTDFGEDSIKGFVRQVQDYKKVRMIGSAALSLALVAAGHVDAYQEDDINFWDVAGGLALVKAAGGSFTILPGSGRWQFKVYAANGRLPVPQLPGSSPH